MPIYYVPYEKCPWSGFIIEGCSCKICDQIRIEWYHYYKIEFEFNEINCHHEWMMVRQFEWYICIKCNHDRRQSNGHIVSGKELEPDEWEKTQEFIWKDVSSKLTEPNPLCQKPIVLDAMMNTPSGNARGRRRSG